ncbi:MAG TPA: hypothetical protein VGK41_05430 [Solirubrobacterales bacterium]
MAGRGNAVFRASVRGYKRTAGRLSAAGREIQPIILAEFRGTLSTECLEIGREFAPEDVGRLKQELTAPVSSRGGTVRINLRSPVKDPDSGYEYTGVTRFGHRKKILKPVKGERFQFYSNVAGRVISPKQVKGYKPEADWVQEAKPVIVEAVDESGEEIGREIETRIL